MYNNNTYNNSEREYNKQLYLYEREYNKQLNSYNKNLQLMESNKEIATLVNSNISILKYLKFNQTEIDFLLNYVSYFGSPNSYSAIMSNCNKINLNIARNEAYIIKYMYELATENIKISNFNDLSLHYRKIYKLRNSTLANYKSSLGMQDLLTSTVNKVPRKIVIGNIPSDSPFHVYNTRESKRVYLVDSISPGGNIVFSTNLKPVLKFKESRELDGVIKIVESQSESKNGFISLSVNKDYYRLSNRLITVASFRRPEFHYGLYNIICLDGTKVYIFNQLMGKGEQPSYKNGTQRVYAYAYSMNKGTLKLKAMANKIYTKLRGVYAVYEKANVDYSPFFKDNSNEEVVKEEEYSID